MYQCGGSLIDEMHIITAAHCLVDKSDDNQTIKLRDISTARIYLGAYSIASKDLPEPLFAGQFIIPPEYMKSKHGNDIALIVLQQQVRFNNRIAPICLPSSDDKPYIGKHLATVGWGLIDEHRNITSIPKEAKLRHIPGKARVIVDCQTINHDSQFSDKSCYKAKQNYYMLTNKVKKSKAFKVPSIVDGDLCALGDHKQDSCFGDSGNPLMWKDNVNGHWFLIGITSGSFETCHSVYSFLPGIYTEVNKFKESLIRYNVLQARYVPYGSYY